MTQREMTALQGYHAARETIYAAMNEGASPVALARLVLAREQAREDAHLEQQIREGEVRSENIRCPWCGHDGLYSGDVLGVEDHAEVECEVCGGQFSVTREVSVDFVSKRL